MMDDPLYREFIMDHWQHPHHVGKLHDPDFSARRSNPTCGDIISLTGTVYEGKIIDIAYQANGCAISVAAASMLSDYVIDKPTKTFTDLTLEKFLIELGLKVSPARLNCALLPFHTLKTALEEM